MPGEQVGEAFVAIRPDTSGFAGEVQRGVQGPLQTALAGISTAVVGRKIGEFFKGAFDEASQAAKVGAQTEAVLKSTGEAAGISAKHISDYAGELSDLAAVDDDVIQQGENVLLTFTQVRNEVGKGNNIFDQATKQALNMSVALGTDLQGSIIQVGKALNDPIAGITALSRVGVSFTEQQKAQIKTLQDSGNVLGAQKLILQELNKEFGGAAASQATSAARLQVAYGNLKESIGTALLPVVNGLAKALQPVAEFLSENRIAATTLAVVISGALLAAMTAYTIRTAQATIATLSFSAAQDKSAKSAETTGSKLVTMGKTATIIGLLTFGALKLAGALDRTSDSATRVNATADEMQNHQGRLRRAFEEATAALAEHRKEIEKGSLLSGLERQGAGAILDDLTQKTRALARESPTLAREFIEQARAAGVPEGVLRKLNKVVGDQEALNVKAAAAAKKDADALKEQADAASMTEDALRGLNDYIKSQEDATLDVEGASIRLDDALTNLWATFHDGEASVSDQRSAVLDTKQAIEDFGRSVFEQNHVITGSTKEAADAQIYSLGLVAGRLAPGSDLRNWLDQYIERLRNGIPGDLTTNVRLTGVDAALNQLAALAAAGNASMPGIITGLDGNPYIAGPGGQLIPLNVPQLAMGGYVPARAGGTLAVIGEGGKGEYVVPEDQMTTAGGVHFHYNELPADAVELARVTMRTLETMRWAYA